MIFSIAYKGRSGLSSGSGGMALSFAPNLRRDRVSFAGELKFPLRFREAVSALHAIVVSDLKYKPKDRSAYQEYLKKVRERENAIRRLAFQKTREDLRSIEPAPMPVGLESRFKLLREKYWSNRLKYSDYLSENDPELWRLLVPCDPVITVAPDVLFFECFSKDESSYGCLTVEREALTAQDDVTLGTTNVDYSLPLFEEFQRLRTYRRTTPGQPVQIVLEPWEARIKLHDMPYSGLVAETIRTWGRDRLLTLARLLPLTEGVEVFLLGTGLPSFWSVRMGGMRLLLGLSGWTANDWTSGGGALADLAPPAEPSEDLLGDIAATFHDSPSLTFEQVRRKTGAAVHLVAAGLNRFALLGQLIHDLAGGVYRWRQILPVEVSLKQVRFDSPEAEAAKHLVAGGGVKISRNETVGGLKVLTGKVENRDVEVVLNADGKVTRGQCNCSHWFRFKLRAGPCRHQQALRRAASGEKSASNLEQWYQSLSSTM